MNAPLPIIHRAVAAETKDINVATRSVTHLISNATQDRAGDIVEPKGWDTEKFLSNPVVLVDHDYRVEKIIGRAQSVWADDSGLYATTVFSDKGLGAAAFDLVQAGIARAWSVGFRPIDQEPIRDEKGVLKGFRFTKQELLEYSLVAIPMNPDAVNNAIQRGIDRTSLELLFSRNVAPAAAALDGANGPRRRELVALSAIAEGMRARMEAATIARLAEEKNNG